MPRDSRYAWISDRIESRLGLIPSPPRPSSHRATPERSRPCGTPASAPGTRGRELHPFHKSRKRGQALRSAESLHTHRAQPGNSPLNTVTGQATVSPPEEDAPCRCRPAVFIIASAASFAPTNPLCVPGPPYGSSVKKILPYHTARQGRKAVRCHPPSARDVKGTGKPGDGGSDRGWCNLRVAWGHHYSVSRNNVS